MFRNPNVRDLRRAADALGMEPHDSYLAAVERIVQPLSDAYAELDLMNDERPEIAYPRTPGRFPAPAENPFGAWYVKTDIRGRDEGPLAGARVGLKDNVCVAGVPMMNGSSLFEGFVPDIDATIVTRILDAGGEIAGKAVCENYCVSGGSHTSSSGPVHNPVRPGYSAGGSSSGSAAVVAAGDVPLSIGTDQAGSVRIPSSYCGVYGMKPTYGLVPYTGITPLEPSMDHAGPISANVRDNARLLQAIAGADGIDPRQRDVQVNDYAAELDRGVQGLRIGVVREGFGRANSEAGVDSKVREAAARFARMGAVVEEISIPMHSFGFAIWAPIAHDGGLWTMLETHGLGIGGLGPSAGSQPYFGARWREAGDDMADTIKIMALFGRYSIGRYHSSYYAKAQRMRARLRAAYDEALSRFDLLLMPTLPLKATPLPPQGAGPEEVTARSWEMIGNTCAFNVTGHPAMTLPCGMEDGRPIGVMLTGKHWNEAMIYGAAAAFEADGDWRTF